MPRVSSPIRSASAASLPENRRRKLLPESTSAFALARRALAILTVLIVAGCAGGGCTSGCACGGLTPLPDGFKANARIENAGSVRLTQSGLGFLEQNLGALGKAVLGGAGQGGVITFAVPETKGTVIGSDYTVCPGGAKPNGSPPTCSAEIDLDNAKLEIDPIDPHNLRIHGPLPVRLQDLPIEVKVLFATPTTHATLTGNQSCPGDTAATFASLNLDVNIDISVDQNSNHARFGYTKLKVKLDIGQDQLQDQLKFCGGGAVLDFILNALKGVVAGPLLGGLQGQIDQQLCLKANPLVSPTCPTGTNDVGGICRYGTKNTDECASTIVGTDGHLDLGGLLASVSPGTKGGLDFLFAAGGPNPRDDGSGYAWGDLKPVLGGATIGMYGGAEPTPLSKCVKLSDMKLPTGIPIPDELFAESVPDWPAGAAGPHLGLAISERFANYALNGMYNSGLFCVGLSTESVPQLSSGILGLLVPSAKDLGIQREPQQVALMVRPSSPPSVTFGNGTNLTTDPLLRIKLNQAAFDFYFFSLDRFIRFMTATFDLDVPLNLTVTPNGLVPVLQTISVTNGKVTNSDLLRDDPAMIAESLGALLGTFVGQAVGGGIAPIDLNQALSALGLKLVIPESVSGKGSPGLRKLSKGANENYLGIFAAFDVTSAQPLAPADTTAALVDKSVDKAAVRLSSSRPENLPSLRLRVGSPEDDGVRGVEYSYRIDQGFWHPFTRERMIDIHDDWMRVQGKHLIQVRARIAGEPMSLDESPAEVEVVIDVDPPVIDLGKVEGGKVALHVRDLVSAEAQALVRVKLDQDRFTAWTPASALTSVDVGDAAEITVEAKDEEGNIATVSQAIRGRLEVPPGCGCALVGADQTRGHTFFLVGIAIAGLTARLARRRKVAPRPEARASAKASGARAAALLRARRPLRHVLGGVAVVALASSWAGCNCGVESSPESSASTSTGSGGVACPDCARLEPGLIGSYTSVAVSGSTLWLAGYAEADYDNGYTYGDLVVGKWDGTKVDWTAVDGVPSEPAVDPAAYDVESFRGGQTEPGDDVGTWTSIAVDAAGNPAVAYVDRTHHALKFAQFDGKKWAVSTVEGKAPADVGRYAKLLAQGSGFVLVYQAIEGGGENGALISKVRVATTESGNPGPSDWSFEDAAIDKNTPCRAAFCGAGTACVAATKLCTATLPADKCSPKCASGSACVAEMGLPTCAATIPSSKLDAYPDAIGAYISIAFQPKGGLGIAYYDRPRGNLMIAQKGSAGWATTLVDGADATGKDTGDTGIGASLAIDVSNNWHIAYVDGVAEALKYIQVTNGTTPGTAEVIDDGVGIDGQPFDDGTHLVGDDASLVVSPSNEIRVTYQDTTAGKLRYAVGAPGSKAHTWAVKAIDQKGFAGAFSHIVEIDEKLEIVNWWRASGEKLEGDVAVVSPP